MDTLIEPTIHEGRRLNKVTIKKGVDVSEVEEENILKKKS
jgi:hypothetical protein